MQALSRGDGSRHSLHASAKYCAYNEDLVFRVDLSTITYKILFRSGFTTKMLPWKKIKKKNLLQKIRQERREMLKCCQK